MKFHHLGRGRGEGSATRRADGLWLARLGWVGGQ
jgi:hypothetical protein